MEKPKVMRKMVMKKLIAKLAVKSAKKSAVKIALLYLVVNATTFSMSWLGAGWFKKSDSRDWVINAERLYHAIAAVPESSQIDSMIKKELIKYKKKDRQKALDYLFERSVREKLLDKAEIFRAHGANPDAKMALTGWSAQAETLLMDCAQCGDAEQVQFLLDHGADPLRYNSEGFPALFFLLWNTQEQQGAMLKSFVKIMPIDYRSSKNYNGRAIGGYDKLLQSQMRNKTLLYAAIVLKKFDFAKQLLRFGADPNVTNDSNPTDYAFFYMLHRDCGEQVNQLYRPIAKMLYCYGGRVCKSLEHVSIPDFKHAKELFDLFNIDKVYLGCTYSPEVRQRHSYQELHGRALVSLLHASSPMPVAVARIACNYSPCMIPDFFEVEDWVQEGFAVPSARTMAQDGVRSLERNGDMADESKHDGDGEAGNDSNANYGNHEF